MKIVCDNCATKYSIADEKVRGKVFKIRCKKCSHIIVVRGGADGNAEAQRDAGPSADAGFPSGDDQATIAAGQPYRAGTPGGGLPAATAAAGGGDAVWHLVIDREQVGPMTAVEVRQKFSNGEVDAETYAWREGFGDWLRLGSIDDFRDLGGGAGPSLAAGGGEEATRRSDSADLFGAGGGGDEAPADQPSGDLFATVPAGGGGSAPAYSSAPAPAAAEADVFGGGGGLFGAPSAAPSRPARTSSPGFAAAAAPAAAAEPAGGVDVRPMTGQRNENSVLFSLNNLQALATGGGGAKAAAAPEQRPGFANSQTEGSGLIDIRAMAASTLAAAPASSGPMGSKDDLPGLGAAPVFSPMAAPILMPAAPSGPPKWMWAILGVGVLAVIGIVIVGVLLLTRKPAEPVVAQNMAPGTMPQAAPGAVPGHQPAAAAPAAAQPAAAAAAPAAAAAAPAATAEKSAADEKKHGSKGAHEKGTKMAKAESAPAPKGSAPEAAAAPPPAAKKSGGKHDALDDLLNDASPDSKPAAKKAAAREESSGGGAADESLPEQLDKGQVVSGMSKVKSNVTSCYDQYHVPGMAMVALTIAPSGRVSSANVTGQFAGTPTGDCVAKAVKRASFPRFRGAPMPINYPYVLR